MAFLFGALVRSADAFGVKSEQDALITMANVICSVFGNNNTDSDGEILVYIQNITKASKEYKDAEVAGEYWFANYLIYGKLDELRYNLLYLQASGLLRDIGENRV